MVDTDKNTFEVKLSHDYIGHFSKFIRKGAKRIAFTNYTSKIEMTAFKNVDGSLVLVLLNQNEQAMPVSIRIGGKLIQFEVYGSSIATAVL